MSIVSRLLTWLSHSVRVDKGTIHDIVDRCDTDSDGYISVAEVYTMIHDLVQRMRR